MLNNKKLILIVSILLVLVCGSAKAEYEISWYSIDGGGGTSSSAAYSLSGSVGQADAGLSSHDTFVQSGGYWAGSFGCVVNLTDLALFCGQWLDTGTGLTADLDESGKVDLFDFAELAYWWYNYCPAGWPMK